MNSRHSTAAPPGIESGRVLALCGGVGGAKLALGLQAVVDPGRLTIVVNTGDDFEHMGLHISPDLDTVTYTLAGINDAQRGWGRADETWNVMAALEQMGGESWFSLGDRDLALHLERTQRQRGGESLSAITADLARRLGARCELLPVTDEPLRTIVHTADGALSFQHYFVKHRCDPRVSAISFDGAERARPVRALLDRLADPLLAAVVICPSNPFLSIDPMLAVPGLRAALNACAAPVVAVSPIVAGQAVKGPTAKIMRELGLSVNSKTVAEHYAGLIDGMVIDRGDAAEADALGVAVAVAVAVAETLMRNLDDKTRLAQAVLAFAAALRAAPMRQRTAGVAT